jgi:hypothetical protein
MLGPEVTSPNIYSMLVSKMAAPIGWSDPDVDVSAADGGMTGSVARGRY